MAMITYVFFCMYVILLDVFVVDTYRWLFVVEKTNTRHRANWELPDSKDVRQRQLCKSETCTASHYEHRGNVFICSNMQETVALATARQLGVRCVPRQCTNTFRV